MDHPGEVDPDLGVEKRRRHRRAAVDDREHRRGEEVGIAGRAGGLDVEVQRIRLADGVRVFPDLLAPCRVDQGRIALADGGGGDGHGADAIQRARCVAATEASTARAVSSVHGPNIGRTTVCL